MKNKEKDPKKGSKGIFKDKPKDVTEDKPTRATHHHGSTTQAGSNFGQGSADLPKPAGKQGSESNDGANYNGEKGWDNEALRREDIPVGRKAVKKR
jgi:hypothetical protein